mmetsp:Transcript_69427/g.206855  ORF Transcript_69427/g.206855 Transcript_69427/m.206855 type:complete len:379 (-) Transcript_69427:74-1210(-)
MAGNTEALLAMGFPPGNVEAAVGIHAALNDALDWLLVNTSWADEGRNKDATPPRASAAAASAGLGEAAAAAKRPRPSAQGAGEDAPRSGSPPRRRLRKGPGPSGTRPPEDFGPQEPEPNTRQETCSICTEAQPPWSAVRLPCRHGWYCPGCLQRFAEVRLGEGRHEVPCPECGVPLGQGLLRAVLPKQTLDRLLERSLEQAVSASDGLWPCPTPDCRHRVALDDGQVPCLQCPQCHQEHCLRCHVTPFHHGQTCEEYAAARQAVGRRGAGRATSSRSSPDSAEQQGESAEELLQQWMKKTGSKQCPRCKMGVTKEDLARQRGQTAECHKMICRNCETRFCFRCLKVLTATTSCRCTPAEHGFINPRTGRFVTHLRKAH